MRFTVFLFLLVLYSFSCFAQSDSTTITLKNRVLKRSAFVGAELGTLTNPVRVAYKMSVEKGIIVYKVFPNLAADKAGLIEKDVIIAVDSTRLDNLKEFQNFIKTKNGNDTLNLFFVRNDTVRNTSLVLHFLPRENNFYFETMYDQLEITDSSQTNTQISIRSIVTFPRNIENIKGNKLTQFPLVIILNSASNKSIEKELYTKNKSTKNKYQFYDWIENLTKNGFATLRIEKTGVGDSNGKLTKWTFENEQKSIYSALEKIKKYGSINQQKIYLVALGSSSFVALENFMQANLDSLIDLERNSKIKFQRIFIEKLPSDLQKTKNQNSNNLLLFFPELSYFDTTYSQKAISNLKKYNLIMKNEKFFWIENKEDILRVISRLKKEME